MASEASVATFFAVVMITSFDLVRWPMILCSLQVGINNIATELRAEVHLLLDERHNLPELS